MLDVSLALRRALGYAKFRRQKITVLLLDSAYHLHAESRSALRALGHKVVSLKIGGEKGARQASEAMQQLLHALLAHRPDMVLTINHIGFDAHGSVGDLLEAVQMPTAVWYVDSPYLLFDGYFLPAAKVCDVFVWDRAYVGLLRGHGAEAVHYLPLACDVATFGLPQATGTARHGVGFVGSSMAFAEQKWGRRLCAAGRRRGKALMKELLADRAAFVPAAAAARSPPDPQMIELAFATWTATGRYRQGLLQSLRQAPLQIFGDADWQRVLPNCRLHPYVPYGPALAALYRDTDVCINATSLQMPTAVNQRVFDVPATGSLVVCDDQEDLHALFAPQEICVYRDAAELADKVAYFGAHPQARQALVQRARTRIFNEHTYTHRLQQLLTTMQRRWAPLRAPQRPLAGAPAPRA